MSQRTPMRAVQKRPSVAPLVAIGAAVLTLLLAAFALPAATMAPTGDSAGARLTRACPSLDAGAQLGIGSAGTGLSVGPLADPAKATEAKAGVQALTKDPVRLSGPLGTPFWGVVSASASSGAEQGLSLVPCRQPVAAQWLTGVRSGADAKADLVLVNLDATEAAVNISLFGPDGQLAAPGGRGIVVSGRQQKIVALGPIVTANGPFTVEVTTSAGRVAAFVRQRLFRQALPIGADWIAAGPAPASVVVLPSIVGGPGARTLVVTNPTERTAQVKVDVLGADGAYSLVGVEQVDVPAGVTRTFPLDGALAGKPAALRLTSTRDIVAAVEQATTGDWATQSGVAEMGASVIATVPLPPGVAPTITLANPGGVPAHVEVTVVEASGRVLTTRSADVPANGSLLVEPGAAAGAVVTVTSGDKGVRVGVACLGNVGTVPGIAVVGLADAAAPVSTVTLSPDPRLGS